MPKHRFANFLIRFNTATLVFFSVTVWNSGTCSPVLDAAPKPRESHSEQSVTAFVNILSISSADSSGQKDNTAALSEALVKLPRDGGVIFFPSGIYRFSSPQIITRSNVVLRGAGIQSTQLVGDLSVPSVIQEGNANATVFNNGIEDMTIARSAGIPPVGTVGIFWASFNYAYENRVLSASHYYDRKWDDVQFPADISIGYDAVEIYAMNAVEAYGLVAGAADVRISHAEFGRNKGELFNPRCGIEFSGVANNINFDQTWLIQRGPSNNSGSMACFRNIPVTASGIYRFNNSYAENWDSIFSADRSATQIKELAIIGGHYSAATSMFRDDKNLTNFAQLSIEDSNITGNISLGNITYARFNGNNVDGTFYLSAADEKANDIVVTGNTFTHLVRIVGKWSNLVFVANVLHDSCLDVSSGNKSIFGNGGKITTDSEK